MDPSKLALFGFVFILVAIGSALVKDLRKFLLVLTIVFAPLQSAVIFYHFNGLMLMDFPMIALLVLSIFAPEKNFRWSFPGISLAITLFLGWTLITCFTAVNTGWAISEWTRLLRGFLLFVCVANYVNTPARLKAVLYALLGTFAFQAMLGTYQWRYGPLGLRILEEIGYEWRSAGTFEHPGVFGDFLILILPIIVRLFVFHRNTDKKMAWLYFGLLAFGAGGLLGSYGRGPWLSFAGAMVIMFIYSLFQRRLRPRALVPMMLLVAAGIAFAAQYADTILLQFTSEDRKSSSEIRKPLTNVAMNMAEDHAALGAGLGCYRLVSLPYARLEYDPNKGVPLYQLAQIAHNSYLLMTCETGLGGTLTFLFFIFCTFKMGRRVLKLNNSLFSNLSLGMMTGILGFIVSINSGPNIMNHQLIMIMWLFAGWITAMSRLKVAAPATRKPAAPTLADPNGVRLHNDQDLLDVQR